MEHHSNDYPTLSYLHTDGTLDPFCPIALSDELLLKGYKTMMTTRHVDERMITLQRQGTISFAMSSLGEEACAVASAAALNNNDWMYPQYRELGILFWREFPIQDYLHHMFCNGKDLLLGRQMPNHFGSRALNIVTVSSPIGTKIPHAAGCAYAMKIQGKKSIAISYFGEGATSEGDFHCGINFAAVRKAPAIFFCRNNGYAISTPSREQFASEGIAPKGIGYGIKTYRVDGNDFFAVYDVVAKAKQYCIERNGPVLIEAMTYRLGAHSTSDDPTRYRMTEEESDQKGKDPIVRLRRYLEKKGLWNEIKEKNLLEELYKAVTDAIEIAKQTPRPSLKSLFEDVYFSVPPQLEEEYRELQRFYPDH